MLAQEVIVASVNTVKTLKYMSYSQAIVNVQKKIFGFWAEYENSDCSTHQLLQAYARLYGQQV